MARENCLNMVTVLSFFVGCAIGAGLAFLVAPRSQAIQSGIRSMITRPDKLTREQVIEEGMYCGAPEGLDMYFPQEEANG